MSSPFVTAISLYAMVALLWLAKGKTNGSSALETRAADVLYFNLLEKN